MEIKTLQEIASGPDEQVRLPVALVTVSEGLELQPEAAFLAGHLATLGTEVHRVPIDFCTDERSFQETLTRLAPEAVFLVFAKEWAEFLARAVKLSQEVVSGPVAVLGDGVEREPLPASVQEGVKAFLGREPEPSEIRPRPALPPEKLPGTPLDLAVFGGASIPDRPIVASLFGECGTAALLASRGGRRGLSPTASLARLEAPVAGEPVALQVETALAPLGVLGPALRRIEWWDRDAREAVLEAAAAAAARRPGLRQSARLVPGGRDPSELERFREAGIDRVIFEVDRADGADPMPASSAAVEDLAPWIAAARRAGLEAGVLLVVGVPGETRASGEKRVRRLRELRPDRLRCVPFEPTGGHPVWADLEGRGWWPPRDRRWIREVHRPLRQPSLPLADFIGNWSDASMLLAEIEAARRPDA